jgi:sugar/nucleoside kinase (ribokinase family)
VLAGLAKIVVVKRGASAAICRSGQEQVSLMPPSVKTVDDVGAGDSFAAGFIHKFLTGAKLEDCLSFANVAGAYSTTKEGGTEAFRDRAALNNFVRQHSSAKAGN